VGSYVRESLQVNDAELDCPFSDTEVKSVVQELPNGKSHALDFVPNEFLKHGGEVMITSLTKLFNAVWDAEVVPESWRNGLIFTIHKDGPETDPANYRGITILSCIGKLFTKLLTKRLAAHLESKELLSEEQGGFRAKRSCVDQIQVLEAVLTERRNTGRHTYLFFLDVKKAFDTVWRDGLWARLWECEVRGKMWRVIRAIYSSVQSSVLVGNERTRWFDIHQGVRQGDSMSPILFAVFIDELVKELRATNLGVQLGDKLLQALLFADDVVIMANSPEDLQQLIDVVERYLRKWRLQENLKKSQVMVVAAARVTSPQKHEWHFGGKPIEQTEHYKYLGVWFSHDLDWERHIAYTKEKAQKRGRQLGPLLRNRRIPIKARLSAWKAIVLPVLNYGAEVWEGNSKQNDALETVQNDAMRELLRCNIKTNLWALRMELGMSRLSTVRQGAKLRQAGRVEAFPSTRLAKIAAQLPVVAKKTKRTGAVERLANCVSSFKLQDAYEKLRNGSAEGWEGAVRKASREFELAEFKHEAERPRSQLAVLAKIKLEGPELEEWLGKAVLAPVDYLRLRLRSGVHGLAASKEQRNKQEGSQKGGKCACGEEGAVETVQHFLLECRLYKALREQLGKDLKGLAVGAGLYASLQEPMQKVAFLLSAQGGSMSEQGRFELNQVLGKHLAALWKLRNEKLSELAENESSESDEEQQSSQPDIRQFFSPSSLRPRSATSNVQPSRPRAVEVSSSSSLSSSSSSSSLFPGLSPKPGVANGVASTARS